MHPPTHLRTQVHTYITYTQIKLRNYSCKYGHNLGIVLYRGFLVLSRAVHKNSIPQIMFAKHIFSIIKSNHLVAIMNLYYYITFYTFKSITINLCNILENKLFVITK